MENAVLLCGTDLRRQERRRADEVVQLSTNKDPDWSGLESTSARLGMKRVEAEVCQQAVPGRRTCPFITTILRVDMLTNIRKAAVVDRDVTAVHRMTVSRMRRTRGLLPRSTPYTAPQRDIVEPAKMEYGKFMYRGRRLKSRNVREARGLGDMADEWRPITIQGHSVETSIIPQRAGVCPWG